MSCHSWTPKSLVFLNFSVLRTIPVYVSSRYTCTSIPSLRFLSTGRCLQEEGGQARIPSGSTPIEDDEGILEHKNRERPAWQVQKEANKAKLGGVAWNPRKRLSPDAIEGVRRLHASQPDKFTTPVLAAHFKVSSEAIRRILKSKWRPSEKEAEDRENRWEKRGEKIWTNLVELGLKPPKQWREMGVGRTQKGEKPRWKSGNRHLVEIEESMSAEMKAYMENDHVIPTTGTERASKPQTVKIPFSERL